MSNILENYQDRHTFQEEEYTVKEYLEIAKENPVAYASPHERMIKAIGKPKIVNSKDDPRLARIFGNKKVKRYEAFSDFYGIEEVIEKIVDFFKHGAQGLEERKQILYMLGDVGSGKSSIAERLKELMQEIPVYVIDGSPVHESPLGLFTSDKDKKMLEDEFGIPQRYLPSVPSPWLIKRLEEYNNDLSEFTVKKIKLSKHRDVGVTKTEPSDEQNSNISSLVGKVDIRKLADYSQDDADSYSYSGALSKANRGIMDFVEMFKAPIKTLNPLLTATQERNYNGTEAIGAIPFDGIVVAHSNLNEFQEFANDSKNEAIMDRINLVRVPYSLRIKEEKRIYKDLLDNSGLKDAPYAPKTLEMLSEFSVMTRLKEPENSDIYTKMKVYNGENVKDKNPKAKSIKEYRDNAGVTEGMDGSSTRFAFKVLSKTFNYDDQELAANPIHMMYVLEKQIKNLELPEEKESKYISFIKEHMVSDYTDFISDELQKAFIGNYDDFGQSLFEKYVNYADHWLEDEDYVDQDTGQTYNKVYLNKELEKIEKSSEIVNPKDFRHEIVNFTLKSKANNGGEMPSWKSYNKIREVIEDKIFTNTEEILPVISFSSKSSEEKQKKHEDFVDRMVEMGYTKRQVKLVAEWWNRTYTHR